MAAGSSDTAALVVGAGPTGLAMASQLARHGVACRIVDQATEPSGNSKAVAIHARTLEVFDNMGIVGEVLDQGVKVHGLSLHAAGGRVAHLAYDELDSPYSYAVDLPQPQTEAILRQYLGTFGVQVEWGTELTGFTQDDSTVTATLHHADGRDETLTTRWILGCDGAHSTVRHTLGMPFEGEAMPTGFAVADVKVDWALPDDEWHVFIHADGLFAAFPIPGGRQRLTVEVDQGADGTPAQPTLEDFQRWMRERGPAGAVVSDPAWMTPFRVSFRRAAHYRQGRAFLAGDAVHIHSPAGGQGMNTCIQDTFNLAWKLALVDAGQAPAALLDSYEAERQPVAKGVLEFTELAGRVITLRGPISAVLRNRLMPLLAEQEVVQRRVIARASELPINYCQSPIVAEHHGGGILGRLRFGGGPRAGDRAPDVSPLQGADASITRLFDVLRTTKHTLLLFAGTEPGADTWQRLDALAKVVQARYGALVQVYEVAVGSAPPARRRGDVALLRDPEGALHHRYGADAECLYLIRPDGYVGFRGQPADAASLQDYLGRIFTVGQPTPAS